MIQTTLKEIPTTATMSPDQAVQGRGTTLDKALRPDVEFDQWATAVREQMIAALKRRGSD